MSNIAVHLACWLLKLPLNIQQRTKLIGAVLDRLDAVPLDEVIKVHDGNLFIQGEQVDYDKASKVRESAHAMLNNQAHQLVREQVAVLAGTRGVVEGDTPEKLYFYRAAIWSMLQQEELYSQLAGGTEQ